MADIADSINNIAQNEGNNLMTMSQRAQAKSGGTDFNQYTSALGAEAAFQQGAMPIIQATANIMQRGQQINQAQQSLELQTMAERTRQQLAGQQMQQVQYGLDDAQRFGDFQTKVAGLNQNSDTYFKEATTIAGQSGFKTLAAQQQAQNLIDKQDSAIVADNAQRAKENYQRSLVELQTKRYNLASEGTKLGVFTDAPEFQVVQPDGTMKFSQDQYDNAVQIKKDALKASAEADARANPPEGKSFSKVTWDPKATAWVPIFTNLPAGGKGGSTGLNGQIDVTTRGLGKDIFTAQTSKLKDTDPEQYLAGIDTASQLYNQRFNERGIKPSKELPPAPGSTEFVYSKALENPGSGGPNGMFGGDNSGINDDDKTYIKMALDKLPDDQKEAFRKGNTAARKSILTRQIQAIQKATGRVGQIPGGLGKAYETASQQPETPDNGTASSPTAEPTGGTHGTNKLTKEPGTFYPDGTFIPD